MNNLGDEVLDFDFLLMDRIQKIKSMNELYNLEDNGYVSFSGGKDSTVLHYLLDLALPNNKIPRVFFNTGIEYNFIVEFVKELAKTDDRIIILKPQNNISEMLKEFGYPFKSKEHSKKLAEWKKGNRNHSLFKYFRIEQNNFRSCPKKLMYQIEDNFTLKISDKCCYKMKKDIGKEWAKENHKAISLTGMRREEGGQRRGIQNCVIFKNGKANLFHPLLPLSEEWLEEFIKRYDIKLCKLYYPPFNFKRTGCKGCPYNQKLRQQLEIMKELLPSEYKQCETIWKPVYDEYRRIKYRLHK